MAVLSTAQTNTFSHSSVLVFSFRPFTDLFAVYYYVGEGAFKRKAKVGKSLRLAARRTGGGTRERKKINKIK